MPYNLQLKDYAALFFTSRLFISTQIVISTFVNQLLRIIFLIVTILLLKTDRFKQSYLQS